MSFVTFCLELIRKVLWLFCFPISTFVRILGGIFEVICRGLSRKLWVETSRVQNDWVKLYVISSLHLLIILPVAKYNGSLGWWNMRSCRVRFLVSQIEDESFDIYEAVWSAHGKAWACFHFDSGGYIWGWELPVSKWSILWVAVARIKQNWVNSLKAMLQLIYCTLHSH